MVNSKMAINDKSCINVDKTRQLGLCVSCEICNAICPVEAIKMEYEKGQFIPTVNPKKCINCGLCLKQCPGMRMSSFKEGLNFENSIFGAYLKIYSSYAKDEKIRKNSTSGGLITQLILKLLEDKVYDGAFVLQFETFRNSPARLKLIENPSELFTAAKSKYIPASVFNIIKTLQKKNHHRYIIVGTPCQITGIKNFIKEANIDSKNLLFLGLFCDSTLNFNIINYFEDKFSRKNEKIIRFDFRNKEKDGWPGHPKLYFDSKRQLIAHRKDRMKVKKYFQLESCLYCLDKLNRSADISFGDCYLRWREIPESSTVIIRTEKGKKIFDKYSYLFNSVELNQEAVIKSQGISVKKENLDFIKIKMEDEHSKIRKNQKVTRKIRKRLTTRKKFVGYGKDYKTSKIKISNILSNISNKWEIIKGILTTSTILAYSLFKDTIRRNKQKKEAHQENVIIMGGGLYGNIGAQAMTFTVVDQIKRRFPKKKIYLFSTSEYERSEKEKKEYKFRIMPWGIGSKLNLLISKQLIKKEFFSDEWITQVEYQTQIENIIKNTSFFIDISGYRLGYRLFQKKDADFSISIRSYDYLLNIMIAKKFSIPYYIFPQSFGPFNYPLKEKVFLYPLLWKYLKYPKKIFAREDASLKYLQKFTNKNLSKSKDIVLLNDEYKLENIFKNKYEPTKINISPDSVGIIPSIMITKRLGEKKTIEIYEKMIAKLLESGKKIYLLGHAQTDHFICKKIKDLFNDENEVDIISEELNVVEIEKIISQFNFIIASRYHSIINAFKNGIPVLAIGWAPKYFELMRDFNQLDYIFDTQKNFEKSKVLDGLSKLLERYSKEKKVIKSKLDQMKKNKIFNILE